MHYGVRVLFVHNVKQLIKNQTSAKEHAKENGCQIFFFGGGKLHLYLIYNFHCLSCFVFLFILRNLPAQIRIIADMIA
jgi:hypothetical protein